MSTFLPIKARPVSRRGAASLPAVIACGVMVRDNASELPRARRDGWHAVTLDARVLAAEVLRVAGWWAWCWGAVADGWGDALFRNYQQRKRMSGITND